jgi:hypothetical protein
MDGKIVGTSSAMLLLLGRGSGPTSCASACCEAFVPRMLLTDDMGREGYDDDDEGRESSSSPILDDATHDESIVLVAADLLPALPIRHGTFHSGRMEVLDTGRELVREFGRESEREAGRDIPSSPSSVVIGVEKAETSPSL